MRVIRSTKQRIIGLDNSILSVEYDNMGEPFREGVRLTITDEDDQNMTVLLTAADIKELVSSLSTFVIEQNVAKVKRC